jgi:hypothetical protein
MTEVFYVCISHTLEATTARGLWALETCDQGTEVFISFSSCYFNKSFKDHMWLEAAMENSTALSIDSLTLVSTECKLGFG